MKSYLEKLLSHTPLTEDEAAGAMTTIMDGAATPAQIAAFLTALRMKGETVAEIAGFARVMRDKSVRVPTTRRPLLDTCGTGGDTVKTFNISTTTAFVVAACGVAVAKHGNRAVTSKCGSADVLEALGARLDLTPEIVGRSVDEVGIGFLFARSHHPAMKHAAPVRAELGIRTVFNALGPLTNPAGAARQLIGVYDASLCKPLAQVLGQLGAERVMVVHGAVGLDEIAVFGKTHIAEYRDSEVHTYDITAADFGLEETTPAAVAPGADARENAALLAAVLHGDDKGPRRAITLANAAAALYVAGVAETLTDGVARAEAALNSHAASARLDAFIQFTQKESPAA
jgi:anthranilate phosphoribosyltransferase